MDQRLAALTLPSGESLPGFLVVLADRVIADRVQRGFIRGDGLVRLRRGDAPQLYATPVLRRSAKGRGHERKTEGCASRHHGYAYSTSVLEIGACSDYLVE